MNNERYKWKKFIFGPEVIASLTEDQRPKIYKRIYKKWSVNNNSDYKEEENI